MVIEQRSYQVLPHKLSAWLALWEERALPPQKEILGGFLGMYLTDIGPVNEVVHMWAYDSLAERERRRSVLEVDQRWAVYKAEIAILQPITVMHSRILRPTSFSPTLTVI